VAVLSELTLTDRGANLAAFFNAVLVMLFHALGVNGFKSSGTSGNDGSWSLGGGGGGGVEISTRCFFFDDLASLLPCNDGAFVSVDSFQALKASDLLLSKATRKSHKSTD
jgi:hypothetical protein